MYSLLKPLLFALPPETAHHLTLHMLEAGGRLGVVRGLLRRAYAVDEPALRVQVWGREFSNPLGLAAGLDKDGRALASLLALGFGFVEAGTVTPRSQPGNARPRLFRLRSERALINRMGFNNAGAGALADRLAALRSRLPEARVGVNLGKNRDTPLEQAVADYRAALATVGRWADYLVINVSSPNTPGLRELQGRTALTGMARELLEERRRITPADAAPPPLLIKVAPDLDQAGLAEVAAAAMDAGCDGLIAANTTLERGGLHSPLAGETGGLSGPPLHARAVATVAALRKLTGGRLPLIGVGGIDSAESAYAFIRAGASLVQVYTGLVYQGPGLVRRLLTGLAERLHQDGFATLEEAVGSGNGF